MHLMTRSTFARSIICAALASGLSSGAAWADPIQFDINGDGTIETIEVLSPVDQQVSSNATVRVLGTGSVQLYALPPTSGPAIGQAGAFDRFGFVTRPVLNVRGDVTRVLAVASPLRAGDSGHGTGAITLYAASDGSPLLRVQAPPGARMGLDIALLGDQDNDGFAELLVSGARQLSDGRWKPQTFLFSAVNGRLIARRDQSVSFLLDYAENGGTVYQSGDLDDSGLVDIADVATLASFIGANASELPQGDLDHSGSITTADLHILLDFYLSGRRSIAGAVNVESTTSAVWTGYSEAWNSVYEGALTVGAPPAPPSNLAGESGPGPGWISCDAPGSVTGRLCFVDLNICQRFLEVGQSFALPVNETNANCVFTVIGGSGVLSQTGDLFTAIGPGLAAIHVECTCGDDTSCRECIVMVAFPAPPPPPCEPTVQLLCCNPNATTKLTALSRVRVKAIGTPFGGHYTWSVTPSGPGVVDGLRSAIGDWPSITLATGEVTGDVTVTVTYALPGCPTATATCQLRVVADSDHDGLDDDVETNTYGTDYENPDTDGDGWKDGCEVALGSSPNDRNAIPVQAAMDSDHDGLSDAEEMCIHATDPHNPDSDGDGVNDLAEVVLGLSQFTLATPEVRSNLDLLFNVRAYNGCDVGMVSVPWFGVIDAPFNGDDQHSETFRNADKDHDLILDTYERQIGSDPKNADSDHDGIIDGIELLAGRNLLAMDAEPLPDTDADGLSDLAELYVHGTDPKQSDSDGDGLPDGWENKYGLNPLSVDSDGNGISDGDEDYDEDGLSNIEEYRYGANPLATDSDGDGTTDYQETLLLSSPTDPNDLGGAAISGGLLRAKLYYYTFFVTYDQVGTTSTVGVSIPGYSVGGKVQLPAAGTSFMGETPIKFRKGVEIPLAHKINTASNWWQSIGGINGTHESLIYLSSRVVYYDGCGETTPGSPIRVPLYQTAGSSWRNSPRELSWLTGFPLPVCSDQADTIFNSSESGSIVFSPDGNIKRQTNGDGTVLATLALFPKYLEQNCSVQWSIESPVNGGTVLIEEGGLSQVLSETNAALIASGEASLVARAIFKTPTGTPVLAGTSGLVPEQNIGRPSNQSVSFGSLRTQTVATGINLCIDSANRQGFEIPLADDTSTPSACGKIIIVNDGDADGDGIPNYADGMGIDTAGMAQSNLVCDKLTPNLAYNPDIQPWSLEGVLSNPGPQRFVPMLVRYTLDADQSGVCRTIRFGYSESSPAGVQKLPVVPPLGSSEPAGVRYALPSAPNQPPGRLRIWRQPGDSRRDRRSIQVVNGIVMGDFIPKDTDIPLSALDSDGDGSFVVYIEAVAPSLTVGGDSITAVVGFGCASTFSSEVKVTATQIETHDLRYWGITRLPNYDLTLENTNLEAELDSSVVGALSDGASICLIRLRPSGLTLPLKLRVLPISSQASPGTSITGGLLPATTNYVPSLPRHLSDAPYLGNPDPDSYRELLMTDGKVFYVPPESFPCSIRLNKPANVLDAPTIAYKRDRRVDFEATQIRFQVVHAGAGSNGADMEIGSREFILRRPPVVLVHGLFGDGSIDVDGLLPANDGYWASPCDDDITATYSWLAPCARGYWKNQLMATHVYLVNYKDRNHQGYDRSFGEVPLTIRKALRDCRSGKHGAVAPTQVFGIGQRFAATRADVVGHSMGGQMIRTYVSNVSCKFPFRWLPVCAHNGGWAASAWQAWDSTRIDPKPPAEEDNDHGKWQYQRADNLWAGDIRRFVAVDSVFDGAPLGNIAALIFEPRPDRLQELRVMEELAKGNKAMQNTFRINWPDGISPENAPSAPVDLAFGSMAQRLLEGVAPTNIWSGATGSGANYPTSRQAVRWRPIASKVSPLSCETFTSGDFWYGGTLVSEQFLLTRLERFDGMPGMCIGWGTMPETLLLASDYENSDSVVTVDSQLNTRNGNFWMVNDPNGGHLFGKPLLVTGAAHARASCANSNLPPLGPNLPTPTCVVGANASKRHVQLIEWLLSSSSEEFFSTGLDK